MDHAAAALQIAKDLGIAHTDDAKTLYGLYPSMFPGGYTGTEGVSLYQEETTWEHVIVALVRWIGWDTVHYDTSEVDRVQPYVDPKGFPYYAPDPTPRATPYIIVALRRGLISTEALPSLQKPISPQDIDVLCAKLQKLSTQQETVPPLTLDDAGMKQMDDARKNPRRLVVLPTGFTHYDMLEGLPNRILDLSAPGVRLFNARALMANGKQDYFPLGGLETQFSVGLRVGPNSFAHQSEAIYGAVENESTTSNAVGIWGQAASLAKNARVWGGFMVARADGGPKKDAQVVGLEVDTINDSLPGMAPNRSKVGIQVVGIGSQPVTNAIEIIAENSAKWGNGLLFNKGSIFRNGTVIALGETGELGRGIDFSQTHFRDFAFSLSQGARITLGNKAGGPSMLYTDDFDLGHLVVRAAESGLRVVSNDDSKNLMVVDGTGNIITPKGDLNHTMEEVKELKRQAPSANVPKAAHDACTPGARAEDSDYIYVCVAKNEWRRAKLSSW